MRYWYDFATKLWLLCFEYSIRGFFLMSATICYSDAIKDSNAGINAWNKGDKEKAKMLFRRALSSKELSKNNSIIVNNKLCGVLWSERKRDEAIDCYSETIKLDPHNKWALRSRGTLYYLVGKYNQAVEDLSYHISLDQNSDFSYRYRALSLSKLKRYEEAMADFNKAIKLKPQNRGGYIHRGKIYSEMGKYSLAKRDFEKSIAVESTESAGYRALAWFYVTCPDADYRDWKVALKLIQKAMELNKDKWAKPFQLDTLAAVYAESGQYQKAIETQKQAIDLLTEDNEIMGEFKSRFVLYEEMKPYRDK